MDRDLRTPKKSQESTTACAELVRGLDGLPMKQSANAFRRMTRAAASSKAHDRDGMLNKEFYR